MQCVCLSTWPRSESAIIAHFLVECAFMMIFQQAVVLLSCYWYGIGMSTSIKPKLSFKAGLQLPPPMRSDVPGTWAYDTMSRRISNEIMPRIIEDNAEELTSPSSALRAECLLVLRDLQASLDCGTSGVLRGICDAGPDVDVWNSCLSSIPEESRNWLNAPWVVSEFYFYRRVVEAFKYFETGYDMFQKQKVEGLLASLPLVEEVAVHLEELGDSRVALEVAIATCLWGNKMDLSLWPTSKTSASVSQGCASSQESGQIAYGSSLEQIKSYILDDATHEVVDLLLRLQREGGEGPREVGIIIDNAGYELVTDIILGHVLLQLGVADQITFHTKAHPTFVSDAINEDMAFTVGTLANSPLASGRLGVTLEAYLADGRFRISSDLFWCQPTAMWDMPDEVMEKLCSSRMVFVKGDANYRRLLGERCWPLETPARDILAYWPVPVCALRTFKAQIGCGVSKEAQARAAEADPNWMVSGRWGVVQLGGGTDE